MGGQYDPCVVLHQFDFCPGTLWSCAHSFKLYPAEMSLQLTLSCPDFALG